MNKLLTIKYFIKNIALLLIFCVSANAQNTDIVGDSVKVETDSIKIQKWSKLVSCSS